MKTELEALQSKNYYEIFHTTMNQFSKDQVSKVFKGKLALQYHPDKLRGDKACFQLISHAKDVLFDDNLRKRYNDQLRFGDVTESVPTEWPANNEDNDDDQESSAFWSTKELSPWEATDSNKCCPQEVYKSLKKESVQQHIENLNNSLSQEFYSFRVKQYESYEKAVEQGYKSYGEAKLNHYENYVDNEYSKYTEQKKSDNLKQTKCINEAYKNATKNLPIRKFFGYLLYPLGGFILVNAANETKKQAENLQKKQLEALTVSTKEQWKKDNKSDFQTIDTWSSQRGYTSKDEFIKYNQDLIRQKKPCAQEWMQAKDTELMTSKVENAVEKAQNQNVQIASAVNSKNLLNRLTMKTVNLAIAGKYIIANLNQLCNIVGVTLPTEQPTTHPEPKDSVVPALMFWSKDDTQHPAVAAGVTEENESTIKRRSHLP